MTKNRKIEEYEKNIVTIPIFLLFYFSIFKLPYE